MFCFDDLSYNVFKSLSLQSLRIYHPKEWETEELLRVKASKVKRYEYYWACNPYLTRKVFLEQEADFTSSCDCDLMFFQSPEIIFQELEGSDILIQPNNYSFPFVKDSPKVGYYCTSFQTFRKNENSLKVLNWWHERTMEWCASTFEEGKFGEQKYLDDWRTRFKKVREIVNVGTNVAPWNIQKYDVSSVKGHVMVNNIFPLVYYHYHSFRMNLSNYKYIITGDRDNNYPIAEDAIKFIYKPYIEILKETVVELKKIKDYRDYTESNPEGVQILFDRSK
jgi:hypothetical protein